MGYVDTMDIVAELNRLLKDDCASDDERRTAEIVHICVTGPLSEEDLLETVKVIKEVSRMMDTEKKAS